MSDNGSAGFSLADLALAGQREVEAQFAAVVFQYPAYAVAECGWLSPDILVDAQVGQFWRLVRERVTSHTSDREAAVLTQQAAMQAGLDLAWTVRELAALPSASFPQAFAAEIARRQYVAVMAEKARDMALAIRDSDAARIGQVLAEMREVVPANATIALPTAEDAHARFERLVTSGGLAIPSGIGPIDDEIGGLERAALLIVAARPSVGKTAIALQTACNVALSGGLVHFHSLEMSTEALWARQACPLVGIAWRDVLAGSVPPDVIKRMVEAGRELARKYGRHLVIDDRPQTTGTIWQYAAVSRPDLVIVDHIRLCKDFTPGEKEHKRLGRITASLHDLAKAFHCVVLGAAQLNRNVEARSREEKAPTLSDLRDSGEIEENADTVLMLHRPGDDEEARFGAAEISRTEVWVRKFRNGQANRLLELAFYPAEERFEAPAATPTLRSGQAGQRKYSDVYRRKAEKEW